MPDPGRATPPLDDAARADLRAFLATITGGGSASTVLVTSRTREEWLHTDTDLPSDPVATQRITLGGLGREEAAEYADWLLRSYPQAQARRDDRAYGELLEWLDGHPLSMRIILPQLDTTPPRALLDALQGHGDLPDGFEAQAGRTASLGASVKYSLDHLDADAQRLLPIVALFQGVTDAIVLDAFSQAPEGPAPFRDVTGEQWAAVLDSAASVGLLTRIGAGMYRIHPALPGYLTAQWAAMRPDTHETERSAAQAALITAHAASGAWLSGQIAGGDAALAFRVIHHEQRTMRVSLDHALREGRYDEAQAIVEPLNEYWKSRGARRGSAPLGRPLPPPA